MRILYVLEQKLHVNELYVIVAEECKVREDTPYSRRDTNSPGKIPRRCLSRALGFFFNNSVYRHAAPIV